MKNVYRTYIDIINFVKADSKRFNIEVETQKKETDKMDIDEDNAVEEDPL